MPQISFVMPTKNRGDIIGESIKSIIEQTFEDWELIVADNHSEPSDSTFSVIDNFNDPRIKYIKVPDNWSGGIAETRNFGNMLASSPIIAVADSDDIFVKDRARLTLDAFDNEDCDIFYGQYEIFNKLTGKPVSVSENHPAVDFSLEKIKDYNIIPHSSVAYKRELAYDFPYNSFFRKAEDYDLFTRLAKAGKKFYFCDQIIFRYVIHGGNASMDNEKGNYGKLIKSNRAWVEFDRRKILDDIVENKK